MLSRQAGEIARGPGGKSVGWNRRAFSNQITDIERQLTVEKKLETLSMKNA